MSKTMTNKTPRGPRFNHPQPEPDFTVGDVAKLYKLSERTIRNHTKWGLLPCSWVGGTRIRISRDDLLVWRSRARRPLST